MKTLALALIVSACGARAPAPQDHGSVSPTKTHEDLDAIAKQMTASYQLVTTTSGSLDWAAPKFEASRNTCYVVVLRLGTGAAWGPGAEHGAVFVYELQFRPLDDQLRHEPIGQGPYSLEVWGRPVESTQICPPAEPG